MVLGVARARAALDLHHGGGGGISHEHLCRQQPGMPTKNDRQFQRALETVERLRAKANGDGKGQSKTSNDVSVSDAWTCRECGYYNFGTRRRCRKCPTACPGAQSAASSSASPGPGKGGGGGGKGGGTKGGGRKESGASEGNGRLLAQIKLLEEQNKALKQSLAEKADGGADDEEELVAEDAEDEAAINADLENLAALQRCYDAALVQLGAEDETAKTLRGRLDAARAKQRAGKPIFQQVQTAQRKATRHEKLHEAAKAKLQELELRKTELEKEIVEQSSKVAAAYDDLTKSKLELGGLLERAKAEKGTAPAASTTANDEGAAPAAGGIHGAAAAWNAAKAAIQQQVAALASDVAPELQQAVAAQYAAMEAVLNRIPAPAPSAPSAPPAAPSPQGDGGRSSKPEPPAAASTTTAAASSAAAAATDGSNDGTGTAAEDDGGATGMLDVDEAVLNKLAEIFTSGGDGASAADGDVDDDIDAPGDPNGDGSRKARRIMDSRVTAARQYLAGRIPLRKPSLKHGGKSR